MSQPVASVAPRRRLFVLVVCALLVVIAVVVVMRVLARDSARLVTDSEGMTSPSSTEGPYLPGPGRYHVTYAGSLCIEHTTLATITSIEPRDGRGGLKVSAFSVFQRPSDHPVGDEPGDRLGEMPDYYGGETVGSTCKKGPVEEIALELYKPDRRDAWASNFTVHYVVDGHARTTNIWVGVALCEKKGCNPFNM